MKMYILVKESAPSGLAINSVGHTALGTYLRFKNSKDTQDWLYSSYKKVTCSVTDEEFEQAKETGDHYLFIEPDWDNDNQQIAIGFAPREVWPQHFRKYSLYGLKKSLFQKIREKFLA